MKFDSSLTIKEIADRIEEALVEEFDEQLVQRKELSQRKEDCYKRYREAAEMGDRSENAPLQEAINSMKEINVAIRECETLIRLISSIEDKGFREKLKADTEDISKLRRYNTSRRVNIYSTVRVFMTGMGDGEEFVFRIYPKGISRPKIGVMAADTQLAIALMGKSVGDHALIPLGHTTINYEIKELY